MACEVPVVATNVGGVPEVVEHGLDGYLFTPREVEIGARYALEILSQPVRVRAMGQRARVNAKKKYCANDVIPVYEEYYRRVIGAVASTQVQVKLRPVSAAVCPRPGSMGTSLSVSTRFRALRHRNFQLFIGGQLISLIGTWMQTTAQLWLIYRLTNSAALLGVFGFASQIPVLFLASLGGYVGDRYNRHRGVVWTQTAAMILAFRAGGADAVRSDPRLGNRGASAFSPASSTRSMCPSARHSSCKWWGGKICRTRSRSIHRSSMARALVGPAIAGFAIGWLGEGWCFFLNGISFLAVIAALLMMRIAKVEQRHGEGSPLQKLHSGLPLRDGRPDRSAPRCCWSA